MPWCQIPVEKLKHLNLFGYDILVDEETFMWVHGPLGRTRIDKLKPVVWFDDIADAAQIGAIAILKPT